MPTQPRRKRTEPGATVKEALLHCNKILRRAADHRSSAWLDAEILLASALKTTKEELALHPSRKLSGREIRFFQKHVSRRGRHEPVAYILGQKEFFGLLFFVNRHVLIPRPETELLVEEAITGIRNEELGIRNIIDVGTGSGAIAVTLAKYLPKAKIIATDISSAALKVAKQNAARHGVAKKIKFIKTNLLPSFLIPNSLFLITANLPYLPASVYRHADPEVRKYEPKSALFGGPDGLAVIKKLLAKIKTINLHGVVLLEIDPSQAKKLPRLIKKIFPAASVEIKKDLTGKPRLAKIEIF